MFSYVSKQKNSMKDKNGHDYHELLAIQKMQLQGIWSDRLVDKLYDDVTEYVLRHNEQANSPLTPHRVFRGQDLIQIIMDWPELKSCYPSSVLAEDVV